MTAFSPQMECTNYAGFVGSKLVCTSCGQPATPLNSQFLGCVSTASSESAPKHEKVCTYVCDADYTSPAGQRVPAPDNDDNFIRRCPLRTAKASCTLGAVLTVWSCLHHQSPATGRSRLGSRTRSRVNNAHSSRRGPRHMPPVYVAESLRNVFAWRPCHDRDFVAGVVGGGHASQVCPSNTRCEYTCESGYYSVEGTIVSECGRRDGWDPVSLACLPCEVPSVPTHGWQSCDAAGTCEAACDAGYAVLGWLQRARGATWLAVRMCLTCPRSVLFARYYKSGGDTTRTCSSTGTWSGSGVTCAPCVEPPRPTTPHYGSVDCATDPQLCTCVALHLRCRQMAPVVALATAVNLSGTEHA